MWKMHGCRRSQTISFLGIATNLPTFEPLSHLCSAIFPNPGPWSNKLRPAWDEAKPCSRIIFSAAGARHLLSKASHYGWLCRPPARPENGAPKARNNGEDSSHKQLLFAISESAGGLMTRDRPCWKFWEVEVKSRDGVKWEDTRWQFFARKKAKVWDQRNFDPKSHKCDKMRDNVGIIFSKNKTGSIL